MTDLQAYLIILAGFIVATAIILISNTKLFEWLIRLIIALFILQIFFFGVRILSLPLPKNKILGLIEFCIYYGVSCFYAGCFAGYFICKFLFKAKVNMVNPLLFQSMLVLYRLSKFAAAGEFFASSLYGVFHFSSGSKFFTISGYSTTFFIFISIVEFLGAMGLLFRKTTLYAAILLMCDMLGAVYTHYHNYFTRHLPDPLGNSVASLMTQTVLITIILVTLYFNKKQVQTSTWIA